MSKVHALDPGYKVTPWQPRGYATRRPHSVAMGTSEEPLHSALLEKEAAVQSSGINIVYNMRCTHAALPVEESETCQRTGPEHAHHVELHKGGLLPQSKEPTPSNQVGSSHLQQYGFHSQLPSSPHAILSSTASSCAQRGTLGLDYSSSDDDQTG